MTPTETLPSTILLLSSLCCFDVQQWTVFSLVFFLPKGPVVPRKTGQTAARVLDDTLNLGNGCGVFADAHSFLKLEQDA